MNPQRDVDEAIDLAALALSGVYVPMKVSDAAFFARLGWTGAHDDLCAKAREITKSGEPLPLDLQEYIVEVASAVKPNGGRPGRSRFQNFGRELALLTAVDLVVALGFSATRNAASDHESACSIVSSASGRLGDKVSEATVAKLWERSMREEREDRENDVRKN
jgi:hypothetical protein